MITTKEELKIEVSETQDAWVVSVNEDRTEGRGPQLISAVCRAEATAKRLASGAGVQGTDGKVYTAPVHLIRGQWYGPTNFLLPTNSDRLEQDTMDAKKERVAKAQAILDRIKSLGMSDEDIAALVDGLKEGGVR